MKHSSSSNRSFNENVATKKGKYCHHDYTQNEGVQYTQVQNTSTHANTIFQQQQTKHNTKKTLVIKQHLRNRQNSAKQRNRKNMQNTRKKRRESTEQQVGEDSWSQCLIKFNESVAHGPIYVCTVCWQTWFRHSVYNIEQVHMTTEAEVSMFYQCVTGKTSIDNKLWVCRTCRDAIKEARVPKLSIENKMGFPEQPNELKLHGMEERLVSPRITFYQFIVLPVGGQKLVRGNVVNVPVDIAPTLMMLPRTFQDSKTIAIKFKRRKQYKKCKFQENIRPKAVWLAVHYLMKNSQLFQNEGINIDTHWLEKTREVDDENCCFFQQQELFKVTQNNDEHKKEVKMDVDEEQSQQQPEQEHENDTQQEEHEDDGYEEVNEDDETLGIVNRDTLLHDPEVIPEELTFAPGEGQVPLSIFYDENSEYLAFPTIFCGLKRPDNKERDVPVHYSEICKYELRSVDRRVAQHIPNLFYKFKKIQMKSVTDTVSLSMRRCKTKGKKITVGDVLNEESRDAMVRLDEGYYIFRNLRNSPAYLNKRKKDAFAMIQQLGFPALFISQSAAETKWHELLKALGKLVDEKTYTNEDIEGMDFQTKARLIRSDPVTVVRYFEHRFHTFFKDVLCSKHKPIGEITDYFWRLEFASRGSIHIHWFAYLKDAPVYGQDNNEDIADYYDHYMSCSSEVPEEHQQFVNYQLHRHTKSCRIRSMNKC